MEQGILSSVQIAVIKKVAESPLSKPFYLSGGTALAAYYFGHRVSDDLDFFSCDEVDGQTVEQFMLNLKSYLGVEDLQFERLYDRRIYVLHGEEGSLKMEFTRYPFKTFEDPTLMDGIQVDSLRDISANKFMAFLDRFDPKDFVDLYFILQDRPLSELIADTESKFGQRFDPIFIGGELSRVKRVQALPKMLKPLNLPDLHHYFEFLARSLEDRVF